MGVQISDCLIEHINLNLSLNFVNWLYSPICHCASSIDLNVSTPMCTDVAMSCIDRLYGEKYTDEEPSKSKA